MSGAPGAQLPGTQKLEQVKEVRRWDQASGLTGKGPCCPWRDPPTARHRALGLSEVRVLQDKKEDRPTIILGLTLKGMQVYQVPEESLQRPPSPCPSSSPSSLSPFPCPSLTSSLPASPFHLLPPPLPLSLPPPLPLSLLPPCPSTSLPSSSSLSLPAPPPPPTSFHLPTPPLPPLGGLTGCCLGWTLLSGSLSFAGGEPCPRAAL